MSLRVLIKPEAEVDIAEANDWYATKRPGLEDEFQAEVERTLERLSEYPESCAVLVGELRRSLLRRFPYGIFYLVENEVLVVVGVVHAARDPDIWTERLAT